MGTRRQRESDRKESMMEKAKISKKRTAIVAAVLSLALAAGLGTYAWLTAQSSLTNTFTVGSINNPDHKPDPTNPDQPGGDDWDVTGNLIETKWVDNSKLTPGASIAKNPNVGLGKGSDNSYVFVYVKNALVTAGTTPANTPYFTINNGWTAVDGQVLTNGTAGQYMSGLFMYTKSSATPSTVPGLLAASETTDVFTGELFSNVVVPGSLTKDMVNGANPTMTVSCYIFGGNQADGDTDAAANALAQAKAWAATQAA